MDDTDKIFMYRYEISYSSNFFLEAKPKLKKYIIIKKTECGYWIAPSYFDGIGCYPSAKKWITKNATKGFARLTKKEALNDFIIVKNKRLQYLKNNVFSLEGTLKSAEKMMEEL